MLATGYIVIVAGGFCAPSRIFGAGPEAAMAGKLRETRRGMTR